MKQLFAVLYISLVLLPHNCAAVSNQSHRAYLSLGGKIGAVRALVFSPDGAVVASISDDQKVRLWDVKTGEVVKSLNRLHDTVNSIAFVDNGVMALGKSSGAIQLFSRSRFTLIRTLGKKRNKSPVMSLAATPNGKTLAVARGDGTLELWNSGICYRQGW